MQLATEPARAKAGVGWIRLVTDIPTALSDLAHGSLSVGQYVRSLRAARTEAVFSLADPFPSIAEFALLPYFIAKKYL